MAAITRTMDATDYTIVTLVRDVVAGIYRNYVAEGPIDFPKFPESYPCEWRSTGERQRASAWLAFLGSMETRRKSRR